MDTTQLASDIAGKIESVFVVLAEKVGVGVEHFYPIFVNQQRLEAIGFILCIVPFFVISLVLLKLGFAFKATRDIERRDVCFIGCIAFTIVFAMLFCLGVCQYVPQLLNPEYSALKDILGMIK